jgi:hypothetical protein
VKKKVMYENASHLAEEVRITSGSIIGTMSMEDGGNFRCTIFPFIVWRILDKVDLAGNPIYVWENVQVNIVPFPPTEEKKVLKQ